MSLQPIKPRVCTECGELRNEPRGLVWYSSWRKGEPYVCALCSLKHFENQYNLYDGGKPGRRYITKSKVPEPLKFIASWFNDQNMAARALISSMEYWEDDPAVDLWIRKTAGYYGGERFEFIEVKRPSGGPDAFTLMKEK